MKYKRLIALITLGLSSSLLGGADLVEAANTNPNMMIEFDNSGSMGDQIFTLPAYAPATTYSAGTTDNNPTGSPLTSGAVYQETVTGSYTLYASNIASVNYLPAQSALSAYGLWFGVINAVPLKLFMGNYMNYEFCPLSNPTPTSSESCSSPPANTNSCTASVACLEKETVAQGIIDEAVTVNPNINFGVMEFSTATLGQSSPYYQMVAPIGTSTPTIVSLVNAAVAKTSTPLGPTLTAIGQYYADGLAPAFPFTAVACQPNSVIIVTDGEFNEPNSVSSNTTSDPSVIAISLHAAPQNLVINTIGLDAINDPLGSAGSTDLANTAFHGGGVFTDVNTAAFAPLLEQALLSLPSGVSITAPLSGSILSGTVSLSAYVQISNCASQELTFYLDGSPIPNIVSITTPPYVAQWNTNSGQFANGTHTLTAVLTNSVSGNVIVSNPISIGILNAASSFGITNSSATVYTTSATITWVTNQVANTQVFYGTTTSYGSLTTLQSTLATSHTVLLTGLTPGTQYFYEMVSQNSANATATSASNFTTNNIIVTPPVVTQLNAQTWITSATISWQTNVPTDGQVAYGLTTKYTSTTSLVNSSNLSTVSSVTLSGLTGGTLYDYQVISFDAAGNRVTAASSLTTQTLGQTLPVITSVSVQTSTGSATISWMTNIPTSAQVAYGLTANYASTTTLKDNNIPFSITSHTVTLNGLTPGTQYDFEIYSFDGLGNEVTQTSQLTTPPLLAVGVFNSFSVTFLNNDGTYQTGPGSKNGAFPYILTAGNCFAVEVQAFDSLGNHYNYDGPVILGQYTNSSGVQAVPGIALQNNFQLGVATMSFTMTNGFLFLGSASNISQDLCFYRSTREPGNSGTSGGQGDLVILVDTGTLQITGVSSSYIVWRGQPSQMVLAIPNQSLGAAMPFGTQGSSIAENEGIPFPIAAYETDQYFNLVQASNDDLAFGSSLSTVTSFIPFSAAASAGTATSTVTVNECNASITLTATDLTNTTITPGQNTVQIAACGSQPYYTVAIPSAAVAGVPFVTTITVNNVNVPAGSGGELFSGNLFAAAPVNATNFAFTGVQMGNPIFSFTVPAGTVGTYNFNIPNESYSQAATIWAELSAQNPSSLQGATFLTGPMTVVPGPAAKITLVANPSTLPPFSSAELTVTITDAYGNGISGQEVTVDVTQGSGKLGAGGSLVIETLITNTSGQAVVPFVSGGTSEADNITAVAPALTGLPEVSAQIDVSLLGSETIAAYPSPVNINQQPLTIQYQEAQASDTTLIITDLFGHEVWRQTYPAGTSGGSEGINTVLWSGQNGLGHNIAVGVYAIHLRMSANGHTTTAKTKFGVIK